MTERDRHPDQPETRGVGEVVARFLSDLVVEEAEDIRAGEGDGHVTESAGQETPADTDQQTQTDMETG